MPANRWLILALLFGIRAGMGIQYEIVAALSPLFIADFSITVADIGLLIGLYHAPGAFLAFPGGAIAARIGDKRVVFVGLVLMALGEMAMALAPFWTMQIAGRLLAGSGGILLNVVMTKMVADWFAGKETSTAMAIIGNAAIFGIALALVALPSVAGMGGRVLASCAVAAYLVVALSALTLYRAPPDAKSSVRAKSFWPDQRSISAVIASGLVYGFYNASLVAIFGFGPLMLTERGWTMTAASSATSVVLWIIAFSLPAGGYLADRTRRHSVILLGGLLGYAAALVLSSRVEAMIPAFILLGIMSGLPCGPIMSLPTQVLTPQTRAVGMGIFFTVYYALQLAGPWLVGEFAKRVGNAQVALDIGAIFLCLGVVAWLVFRLLVTSMAIKAPATS